jgi:hypothetical protein
MMECDFFDPPWEQTDVVPVDRAKILTALRQVVGCESCSDDAEIPLDNVLDRVTSSDPSVRDYVWTFRKSVYNAAQKSPKKTLVEWEPPAEGTKPLVKSV